MNSSNAWSPGHTHCYSEAGSLGVRLFLETAVILLAPKCVFVYVCACPLTCRALWHRSAVNLYPFVKYGCVEQSDIRDP